MSNDFIVYLVYKAKFSQLSLLIVNSSSSLSAYAPARHLAGGEDRGCKALLRFFEAPKERKRAVGLH
ncbi:MAG: hypothetical protein A3A73_00970 [Omnitrophica bacterium RIFCSPLOWO2_01_FULL_50_24]|nr:MAG: hypothetical protein A3A73_00970 [Omnitrophica bacterium RIFCSPLOWO2_01_FULL_50_24]